MCSIFNTIEKIKICFLNVTPGILLPMLKKESINQNRFTGINTIKNCHFISASVLCHAPLNTPYTSLFHHISSLELNADGLNKN